MSKGGKSVHIRALLFVIYLALTGITGVICAQDTIPATSSIEAQVMTIDSIHIADSIINVIAKNEAIYTGDSVRIISTSFSDSISAMLDSIFFNTDDDIFFNDSSSLASSTENITVIINGPSFKPNPKIATRVALIFPGFGQAYNRQYWKLPIVYGGLMGFAYAITWNNKTYQDYKDAYFDIVTDSKNDPQSSNPEAWSQSWQDFLSGNIDPATRLHDGTFHSNLKRGKDYFRRYRDLSIILGVGFYLICVADAYVDAQMFDFDVSPDLSFRFTPVFVPETLASSRCFGIKLCMTF